MRRPKQWWLLAMLLPTRKAEDLFAGWWHPEGKGLIERAAPEPEVEIRCLADYDAAPGLNDGAVA